MPLLSSGAFFPQIFNFCLIAENLRVSASQILSIETEVENLREKRAGTEQRHPAALILSYSYLIVFYQSAVTLRTYEVG